MAGYNKLNRRSDLRKATLRDLVTQLILHDRITTTKAKAKELKRLADKMVTLGKKNTVQARQQAAQTVRTLKTEDGQTALKRLFDDIAPRYADRNGGYTRIYKMGPRRGDAAEMAIIEFVE
ncbi:MAG: 50S ribosomal protein L17 [Candidatus Izimaplasma sp.]|nr:50S ribosomal protein L17 [Candidatus Izimaplasma bacterium]